MFGMDPFCMSIRCSARNLEQGETLSNSLCQLMAVLLPLIIVFCRSGKLYTQRMVQSRRFQKLCSLKGIRLYIYAYYCTVWLYLHRACLLLSSLSFHFPYFLMLWLFLLKFALHMVSENPDNVLIEKKNPDNVQYYFLKICQVSLVNFMTLRELFFGFL